VEQSGRAGFAAAATPGKLKKRGANTRRAPKTEGYYFFYCEAAANDCNENPLPHKNVQLFVFNLLN
jgi:hypothetical protein